MASVQIRNVTLATGPQTRSQSRNRAKARQLNVARSKIEATTQNKTAKLERKNHRNKTERDENQKKPEKRIVPVYQMLSTIGSSATQSNSVNE